jgi:LysR family transcriptional regulator for bpeEF and oprC
MDQFLAIRTFVRIAETGTFAKAAESLGLPRSTASKLIADLEDRLGTKLVQRTTRTVIVTPEGAAYYERAIRLIGELEDMDAAAKLRVFVDWVAQVFSDIGRLDSSGASSAPKFASPVDAQ